MLASPDQSVSAFSLQFRPHIVTEREIRRNPRAKLPFFANRKAHVCTWRFRECGTAPGPACVGRSILDNFSRASSFGSPANLYRAKAIMTLKYCQQRGQ